jgi:DNA-binding transcriptional LysR family regulator
MELRLLRYFIAVGEELHFARAAERLSIEQSPLSRAIRGLEDQLGVQLLKRTSRSTHLTPAGEAFLVEAKRVLATFDDAVASARSVARGYRRYLRIGICDSQAHPRITSLLSRCREEQPDVNIRIFEMPLAQQMRGIQQDLLDGGIAFSSKVNSDLIAEAIWSEPLSVVMPGKHPLLRHERVEMKDVAQYPLVLCHPEAGSGCYEQLMDALQGVTAPLQVVDYATNLGLLLTLVGAGYGISFAVASHVRTLRGTELDTRPIAGRAPTMTTYLLRPPGVATEPMASFIRLAREQ